MTPIETSYLALPERSFMRSLLKLLCGALLSVSAVLFGAVGVTGTIGGLLDRGGYGSLLAGKNVFFPLSAVLAALLFKWARELFASSDISRNP
jgi:hypothetical protein